MKPNSQTAVLFSVLVGVVALSSLLAFAQEQQPPADAAGWVRQLGHPEYARREAASAELASLGLRARDHLVAGLQAEDAEVRRRCRRILAHAIEADSRRRIADLLAGRAGGEHDLPGWAWYRHAIGNDDDARSLYAAMLLAEPGLFAVAEQGPQLAEEAFKVRFAQLRREQSAPDQEARRQPDVASVAALLLVATNPQWRLPEPLANHMHLINFVRTDDFTAMIERGRYRTAVRRLLGHWMLISDSANIVHQKLRLVLQYEIHEGLPLALALLEESETRPPNVVAFAAESVARLGGNRYVASLLPLLEDQRQCARAGKRTIEVRDAVLAWLVYTTGQDIDDYGQPMAKSWFHTLAQKPIAMFNLSRFGYEAPERRSEALSRWADWIEANPLGPAESPRHRIVDRRAEHAGEPPLTNAPALPNPSGLAMADRILVRRLRDAEQLALQEEFSLAAREFGRLLTLENDFYYQPDRDVPVFRHLKSAAEKAIGQFPAEGLAAYQLLYGAEAQRRLDEAVRDKSREKLARVSQAFFHTAAGAEAMYLLGADYWQAGQWFSAAACWQRLLDSGDRARRFEPALSIQLAACRLALGEPWRVTAQLAALKASSRSDSITIGEREVRWFHQTGEAPGWLATLLGRHSSSGEPAWPVSGGRPSRNPITESGSPYLTAAPLDLNVGDSPLHHAVRDAHREHIARRRAMLPTFQPLVLHDTILYRGAAHIRAVRIGSGELLWEATPEDALTDLLTASANDRLSGTLPPAELLHRLWRNPACGSLSSNGRFVFAVERLPIRSGIQPKRMVLHRDGARHLDSAGAGLSGLAAYDAATGKLRWEAGGPADGEGRILAGVSFLGPPLPLGANVYCIVSADEKTALLALDAATGAVQWQRVLAVHDETIRAPEDAMALLAGPQPSDRSDANGIAPSLADGTLVCPISGDQVVAVDLTSRSIVWLYHGRDDPSENAPHERADNSAASHAKETPHDQWSDVCATTVGEHVLITPAGSDRLICLRMSDGVEQWAAPRGDGLYLGGVYDDLVLIVGRSVIRARRLADGKPAWKEELALPPGAMPSGRGYLSQGRLYVPLTTAEVLGVDVNSGRIASRSRSPAGIVPGNLVGLDDCVVSQDCFGLWQFDLAADRAAQAAQRVAESPNSAAAWAERGSLLLCEGRIAEAVDCLSRACRLQPTAAFRLQLARAVTDGLWTDYGRFQSWIDDLNWQGMEPGQQAGILRAIGWSAERAGDRATALDAFLTLAKVDPAADAVQPLSAAVRVRRDRWLAARLDELLSDADPAQRAAAAEHLASLADESLVRYLPFQPIAVDARIRLSLQQESEPRTSEQLLRAAFRFAAPEAAATPARKLVEFHYRHNQTRDATRWMALLERLSANQAASEPPPTPGVGVAMPPTSTRFDSGQRPLWPADTLQVTTKPRDGRQAITCPVPVRVRMVDPSFDRPTNVRVENVGRTLYGYDDLGRQTWELPLSPMKQQVRFRNGHYLAEGAPARSNPGCLAGQPRMRDRSFG